MLRAEAVSKQFPNGYLAVQGISLNVAPGEILGIVGGSGCGKSTLLRLLCGLEAPTQGNVFLGDHQITGPRDDIGVVFQEPRLMPWLTVSQNVQFGLQNRSKEERESLAEQALTRVGLHRVANAWPRELSGGQAQRAAIARALVAKPQVLLLDEPFSALDAFTRLDLQDHVLQLWEYDHPTLLLVTHDIEEALALSDRVVVMRGHPGRIHGTYTVDLPRPRARSSARFQTWKDDILRELHITLHPAHPESAPSPRAHTLAL
ncbi:MAG TPA: ABC transporter ATP-binding protein [bacterium]